MHTGTASYTTARPINWRPLIEHGNRYDPANVVDHNALRQLRSLQSRHQFKYEHGQFAPPVGSRLVAELMNPIELVINGDFVDFLAEEHTGGERWVPFNSTSESAVDIFDRVPRRESDAPVFDALGEYLNQEHRLVLIMTNPDKLGGFMLVGTSPGTRPTLRDPASGFSAGRGLSHCSRSARCSPPG